MVSCRSGKIERWLRRKSSVQNEMSLKPPLMKFVCLPWYCTVPIYSYLRPKREDFSSIVSCHHYWFKHSFQLFLLPCVTGFFQGLRACQSPVPPPWRYTVCHFLLYLFHLATQLEHASPGWGHHHSPAWVTRHPLQLWTWATASTVPPQCQLWHGLQLWGVLSPAGAGDSSPVVYHQQWAEDVAQCNSVLQLDVHHHLLN